MNSAPRPSATTLSTSKKLLFSLVIVVAFFALAEIALLIAGVRPVIWDEDPYVGFQSSVELFQPTADGQRLTTADNKRALFNAQEFARNKPSDTYRIFTLGGSTTYGRPFEDPTSFTGWLRTYLEEAAPEQDWEVINAGAVSYASYRVAKLMEELLEYQPDLFVIYSGNNEFLEQRSYAGVIEEPQALTATRMALSHSRVFTLARNIRRAGKHRAERAYELKGDVDEILNRSTGLEAYQRDDPLTEQILAHYRFNLLRMIDMARSVGATVALVTLPVNEKDFPPFKNQPGAAVAADDRARVRALLEQAAELQQQGAPSEARAALQAAIEIDPQQAESHYRLGKVLVALGESREAEAAFARAVVEDVCPLRALPAINAIVRDVATKRDVPLVDFERELKAVMLEEHGLKSPGDEYFLDHVHPTVDANGLLAEAILHRLLNEGLVSIPADWQDRVGETVQAEVRSRADDEARALAFKNLSKVLIWAGKMDEAERYVRRAAELRGDDWEVHYNTGVLAIESGDTHAAIEDFSEAIRLNPGAAEAHDFMGIALADLGRFDEAVEAARTAIGIDSTRASFHNNLATHLVESGNLEQARRAAQLALDIADDFAEAHNTLGNAWFADDRLDEALASYTQAIALRPNYAEARVNRGLALGAHNRLEEAVTEFRQALRHEPTSVAAHVGLGRAELGLGDNLAAIQAFRKAAEIEPENDTAQEWLARSLLGSGQTAEGERVLTQALRRTPDSPGLLALSARVAASRQQFREAIRMLERALETLPSAPTAIVTADGIHHSLASMLLQTNQIARGRAHLLQALEENPDNVLAINDLGLLYELEGQLERALAQYEQAQALNPNFGLAAENRNRVQQQLASR